MIETSSVAPRKSSATFGNLRKIFEKCSEMFIKPSEQFWKIFGNLGWVSCLTSPGSVTLASGATFIHINALARLTGTTREVSSVT